MVRVLIAGAGIGGLTAALACARAGYDVQILEKTSKLGQVGAGLQLSANAMHVLRALGVEQSIAQAGYQPNRAVMNRFDTGETLLDLPLRTHHEPAYGAAYYNIHRADLHDILLNAARQAGAHIHLGTTVEGYSQTESAVTIGGHQGDVLIGADGIRSAVRDQMHGAENPRFTGQVAWRGTVESTDPHSFNIPADATIWAGQGLHIVTYYLREAQLVNFVAVEEQAEWQSEGWSHQGDLEHFSARFSGGCDALTHLFTHTKSVHKWGLFDRPPLPFWSENRATLLGDSAHPMLPFMAQGAAMAIEDAWVLADALTRLDPVPALASYQAKRIARTTMLQQISRDNAAFYHRPLSPISRCKQIVARRLPFLAHRRLAQIYGVDVTRF